MDMTRPDVDVEIEELVLEGFDRWSGAAIGAALETALAGLLSGPEMPPALTHSGRLGLVRGSSFDLEPRDDAAVVGRQVAAATYAGLNR
jgi:hypothetical protein